MRLAPEDFNGCILEVSDSFIVYEEQESKKIEIDILSPDGDRSIWITKKEVKLLIKHLVNVL